VPACLHAKPLLGGWDGWQKKDPLWTATTGVGVQRERGVAAGAARASKRVFLRPLLVERI
jgi:hypothetical protein